MKRLVKSLAWLTMLSLIIFISCQKQADKPISQQSEEVAAANSNKGNGHLQQTKTFSSEVVIKWLNLDKDLLRLPLPTGTSVQGGERILAYSGIALYESVVNGMPAYQSLSGQLTDFHPTSLFSFAFSAGWRISCNPSMWTRGMVYRISR